MQFPEASALARAGRLLPVALVAAISIVLAPGGAGARAASPANLVGEWRFDEGGGQQILDSGPTSLHGHLGATAAPDAADPLRVPGDVDGALSFDGASFVTLPNAHALDISSLTVETVARAPDSPGPYRYLVSRGSRDCLAGSWGLYTARDGGVAFYVFDGERYFVSAAARPADVWDGTWHRISGTYDGSLLRLFVDGHPVGDPLAMPPGSAIEYESMPDTAYFGTYVGDCRLPFSGEIDSVAIWSRAGVVRGAPSEPDPVGEERSALPAAAGGMFLGAEPTKRSTCVVRASRRRIPAYGRSIVTVRVAAGGGPLRRVRLTVRYAGGRALLAAPRTNASGSVRVKLRARGRGRVRIGVLRRPSCTPAFISVTPRR